MRKLFAVDLDGTLFYPKHPRVVLTKKTKNIIKKIIQNGDVFSVVSGRNFLSCRNVFSLIDEDPYIIGCNGSFIYLKDKFIQDKTINNKFREMYDFVTTNYETIGILIMTNDGKFIAEKAPSGLFYRFAEKVYNILQGKLLEKYIIDYDLFQKYADEGKIRKLFIIFGISKKAKEAARSASVELNKRFNDIAEVVYSNLAVEISPKGCTKAQGVIELAKQLNISPQNVYVIGDSGNDISMFETFYENSYCISKADESVKKHAKHLIKNFDEIEKII